MSQVPVMPIYPDALIGDTMHLSAEEFGAYLLLLFATWRNNGNPLPDDPRKLARICRCPVARWNRVLRPALIGFFWRDDDGCLHQKRLEKEWRISAQYRAKQAALGALGGRPRKSDNQLETEEKDKPNGFTDAALGTTQKTHTKTPVTKLKSGAGDATEILANPPETLETAKPNGSVWLNPNETNPNPVGKEEDLAIELNLASLPTARETTPPLPSPCDGVAASRSHIPESTAEMLVRDDPALRAYCEAKLGEALANLTGMLKPAKDDPPPTPPHIVEFRAMLRRLNSKVGEQFSGVRREQAWLAIATAEAIGDPNALPPDLVAQLACLEAAA